MRRVFGQFGVSGQFGVTGGTTQTDTGVIPYYNISNHSVLRTLDANDYVNDNLADLLATLILDLRTGTPIPTYTITNGTELRTLNANSYTTDNLADLLATIVDDLGTGSTISGYTVSNDVTLRTLNADSYTTDNLADLIATLIRDLGGVVDTSPTISTTTLPDGENGAAYSETIAVTGGDAPITFAVQSGDLPDGLTLDTDTGEISGTPTVEDVFSFTIRATDDDGDFDDQALSITVTAAAPSWTPADLPDVQHWFKVKALTGLSDNDPVSTLTDLMGNANATSSGTARPTYKANGGDPYVELDGLNDVLTFINGGGWSDLSGVFIVELVTTGADYVRIYDSDAVTLHTMANEDMLFAVLGSGATDTGVPSAPTGFMAVYIERNGTTGKLRRDGNEVTATVGTSGTATTNKLGEFNGGGFNKSMRLKEAIFCNNNLSAGDFSDLAAYILSEYGLTL